MQPGTTAGRTRMKDASNVYPRPQVAHCTRASMQVCHICTPRRRNDGEKGFHGSDGLEPFVLGAQRQDCVSSCAPVSIGVHRWFCHTPEVVVYSFCFRTNLTSSVNSDGWSVARLQADRNIEPGGQRTFQRHFLQECLRHLLSTPGRHGNSLLNSSWVSSTSSSPSWRNFRHHPLSGPGRNARDLESGWREGGGRERGRGGAEIRMSDVLSCLQFPVFVASFSARLAGILVADALHGCHLPSLTGGCPSCSACAALLGAFSLASG